MSAAVPRRQARPVRQEARADDQVPEHGQHPRPERLADPARCRDTLRKVEKSLALVSWIDRARKVATWKRNLAGKHPSHLVRLSPSAHQLARARFFLEGASIDVAPPRYDASRHGLTLGWPRWQWQDRRVKIAAAGEDSAQ